MYNCHKEVLKYHNQDVTLPQPERRRCEIGAIRTGND